MLVVRLAEDFIDRQAKKNPPMPGEPYVVNHFINGDDGASCR